MDKASECAAAIRAGNIDALRRLLTANPALASASLIAGDGARTLLHVATDWPGHFPHVSASIALLIAHGAHVDAAFTGRHSERPLHWAASSDDVDALDALLDHHADIEAPGAVISGGTPLADAVAFRCWRAARRLVERGARTTLWQAAALGLLERVREYYARPPLPAPADTTNAFWNACHGGHQPVAEFLLAQGADLNWIGHDRLTGLDAADRGGAAELAAWLRARGATSALPPG